MSAPAEPRFVVRSVTGFGMRNGGGHRPLAIWYVYDRFYCYRIVATARQGYGHRDPESEARSHADRLEQEWR